MTSHILYVYAIGRGNRIEAFIDLFTTELPASTADFTSWAWKLAKKVLNLVAGAADLYQRIAADNREGAQSEIVSTLDRFIGRK